MRITHPKKWFLWSLILIFLFACMPVWAGEEGVVTGSVVNVRKGPGTSYGIVAKTKAGQQFTVLEGSGGWLKVRLHNGTEGWISKDLIYTVTVLKKVTVVGDAVNLRKGPGTDYAKIGQVKAGQSLSVCEIKNEWYRVQAPGVGQAWIAAWLTQEEKVAPPVSPPASDTEKTGYVMVAVNVLNVRSGPGTNYSIVTKIGLNEKRAVVAQQDGWYKIQVGELQGWVSGEHVQPVESPPPQDMPPQEQSGSLSNIVAVTGSIVNIRHQPTLDSPVVAKTYHGEHLAVTGRQGDWLQVKLSDSTIGWIAAWLTEPAAGNTPSRGYIQESEALIAPIADGKTFKVVDSTGRPILVLEGWSNNEYLVKTGGGNTLVLELQGPTQRNYEGKITRLGISSVKIYPREDKCVIELAFTYAPTQSITYDGTSKVTRIQVGAVSTQGLSGKVIAIDPGHASVQPGGWLDPGAIGSKTGLKEKDVNLSIALKLKTLLEQAGARVIMTHTGQTELSLAERAWLANNNNADIFVSIHANFNVNKKLSLSGHSTYYYAPSGDPVLGAQRYSRQKLAALVQRELVKAGGRNDLGVLQESFAVLRETRVPSILVETAFLSDPAEESLLATDSFRQKLATGIFNGIKAYFE